MIKKLLISLLLLITFTYTAAGFSSANAAGANLISNASVETSTDGITPTNWQKGGWGNNQAQYSYETTGQDGVRSIKVAVTQYSSGDAKWFFNPVSVSANTDYFFSDYYQSNISSDLVLQLNDPAGNTSYQWLQTLPASQSWAKAQASFKTPANIASLTVLHLISSVGYLQTDNFYLGTPDTATITDNVPNNSVEQTSNTNVSLPLAWQKNSWGTNNSTFSYVTTDAHTGSRSIRVDVSSYTNGDAKWYFDPQPATPNQYYTFSDWYKSNVSTDVILMINKTDGTTSYLYLGTATPNATTWSQFKVDFTMPANTTTYSILHTIAKVGFLMTDDYSLIKAVASQPIITNNVPNATLSQSSANPSLPLAWNKGVWGNNNAKFTYHTESGSGRGDNYSLQIEITSYTNGDAKWYFDPQPIQGGQYYQFTDWYKTNTSSLTTRVVVAANKADGSTQFIELPTATGSTTWKKYTATFQMPSDTVSYTAYHLLDKVGILRTDDYALIPATALKFNQPLISLTFDDSWASTFKYGKPLLDKYGFKSTQYVPTGLVGTAGYVTKSELTSYKNAGHQLASHSVSHSDLTTLSPSQVDAELKNSKSYLESNFGITVKDFAYPYGAYNPTLQASAAQYYRSQRTSDTGYNTKTNFDPTNIRVQYITSSTTLSQFQEWVNQAIADNSWLVIMYHQVQPDTTNAYYGTTPTSFDSQMNYIKTKGVAVKTVDGAITDLQSQM